MKNAFEESAFAVIDPAYSTDRPFPARLRQDSFTWLYPRAEYECFLLRQMREAVVNLKMNVGYPGCFHDPVGTVYYRKLVRPGRLELLHNGTLSATLNGRLLDIAGGIPAAGELVLTVSVDDAADFPPGIASQEDGWEASIDGVCYEPAVAGGNPRLPQYELVDIPLQMFSPGCYDAGREVLAELEIHCPEKPDFGFGESLFELENSDPALSEQNLELRERSPGVWGTPDPLAFRYVRVSASRPVEVFCKAHFEPVQYRGAFAADEELTRIWMYSAYTLRLCRQSFLLDGIKRDRLPWMGDLAISLLANACCFADPEPVRRTLTVLGRAGIRQEHINGMTDYSCWYLICHDLFQLYYGDRDYLLLQYAEIRELTEVLLEQSATGIFLPAGARIVIDWADGDKYSALQMLFHWALSAAAGLAERMGDQTLAGRCLERRKSLYDKIHAEIYDSSTGCFGDYRHTNFLAILAGVIPADRADSVVDGLLGGEWAPVGTPYMATLEILALYRCGKIGEAIQKIRDLWGGMLKLGATSFWEVYDSRETGNEHYAFYGRPYGRSLCHAWSAGPVYLLPLIFFGCEPTRDGWEEYRTEVRAGATGVVPTPQGLIEF